jgi:hypothetical protein
LGRRAQSVLQQDTQDVAERTGSTVSVPDYPGNIFSEINNSAFEATEDELLLDRYQRLMAPNMPFVVLPRYASAVTLAKTNSFLMHAIRVVSSFHDTSKQQALAKDLMQQICERLLVNGEKSLEILQGLLVFLNWHNPHVYAPHSSTNLFHLAIALTTDLNIDRGTGTCEKAQMESAIRAYGATQASKTVTNDERRAVLGTFYLTSVISTSFRKVDPVRWTPWLSDCASALSEAHEHQSDGHLVQLVHMQRIMQETMAIEYPNAPCQFYASSFLRELEKISTFSGNGTIETVVRLQDACTRVAVWQRSFANLSGEIAGPSRLRQRLEGMWYCMEASKTFIDIYMDISVQDYLVVPFGVFAQFAYVFVVIVRALSLQIDGWDAPALRRYIDLSEIADNAYQRFDSVSRASLNGVSIKNEAFTNWGVRLRMAKTINDAKLASTLPETQTGLAPGQASNGVHITVGLDPDLAQHLPISPVVGTDPFLQSWMGFEDFWSGSYDPSQAPGDLGLDFGSI